MYCTMNFLSLLVATSKKHNYFSISKENICPFSAAHELQSFAIDPDYGIRLMTMVFIGYQMPANKHEGLNACLDLLRKNLNNLSN